MTGCLAGTETTFFWPVAGSVMFSTEDPVTTVCSVTIQKTGFLAAAAMICFEGSLATTFSKVVPAVTY